MKWHEGVGSLDSPTSRFLICTRENLAYFIYTIQGRPEWNAPLHQITKKYCTRLNQAAQAIDENPKLL